MGPVRSLMTPAKITCGISRIGVKAIALSALSTAAEIMSPIMALVLTVVAVPLSRLRPRQGRYARVGFAIIVYFIYSNLLSASKVWVEKGTLSPVIGVWWVHLLLLSFGIYLLLREARTA